MNNWNVFKTDEAFVWRSEMPPVPTERLLDWQRIVLEAGDRHEVMRVLDAPDWGYQRDRDGPVVAWLERHGERIEPMDSYPAGFLVGHGQAYTCAARLAYLNRDDIVEGWFTNLGEAALAAGVFYPGGGYPPISVDTAPAWREEGFTAHIATATDIWFPHNMMGSRGEPADNRTLSRINAARLNAFLREFRDACRDLGGDWSWTPHRPGTWEVDDQGFVSEGSEGSEGSEA
ncbi:hypothetical protein L3i22_074070 [Actinoplanes sp. L3-i22]|nr:hypothetical protein L3i22_074070 [Actinoplanes sp. L3-i22]